MMPSPVKQILERLGGPAVLVPIPRGRKGPTDKDWQKATLAVMDDPSYLQRLNNGNIGVLTGNGLCTLDIDDDEEAKNFFLLNPQLANVLRTSRVRGCNVWLRIQGEHPASGKLRSRSDDKEIGEWRAGGGLQTVIHGEAMDASKGEQQPTAYRFVVEGHPADMPFNEIKWPRSWQLPWEPSKKETGATKRAALPEDVIILPSGSVSITACANYLFSRLARSKRLFARRGRVMELTLESSLEPISSSAFRSRIENCGQVMAWRRGRDDGFVLQNTICSEDTARALLESEPALRELPAVESVTTCPIAIEDEDGNLRVLAQGHHPERGGLLIVGNAPEPSPMGIDEAVTSLSCLLDDFDFVSPGDRSRALAAFISPALVIGRFIDGRVPADVAEADQSQAGKGYRQKVIAAIYNDKPSVVAQRNGGVGGLDESFSQALIRGRPFIQLDNLRGRFDSTFLESFFTADTVDARVPHRAGVPVDPCRYFIFASSNGVETTRDLANRSSIVRIRKRVGHQYRVYREGELLSHVRARQGYYLGCVYSVIREWLASGKPHTDETRHDFRTWAQTLDWIVQRVFRAAPLLDGHQAAQERVSNPALVFLRGVCLATEQAGRLGESLLATDLMGLAEEHAIAIPGLRSGQEDRAFRQIGIVLSRVFRGDLENVEVDGFLVKRTERPESRDDGNGLRILKAYEVQRI